MRWYAGEVGGQLLLQKQGTAMNDFRLGVILPTSEQSPQIAEAHSQRFADFQIGRRLIHDRFEKEYRSTIDRLGLGRPVGFGERHGETVAIHAQVGTVRGDVRIVRGEFLLRGNRLLVDLDRLRPAAEVAVVHAEIVAASRQDLPINWLAGKVSHQMLLQTLSFEKSRPRLHRVHLAQKVAEIHVRSSQLLAIVTVVGKSVDQRPVSLNRRLVGRAGFRRITQFMSNLRDSAIGRGHAGGDVRLVSRIRGELLVSRQ
ncbi:MAG TPA: hypothetical protein VL371_16045 [Gemmataceae bacterium]|nr:hypothetical protein [Gemmataceae bacterium]